MITMVRSNGRIETIANRDKLVQIIKATAKKVNPDRQLTYAQCGAIANDIISGKKSEFCGRLFEVRA